jgi:hypothetical protein
VAVSTPSATSSCASSAVGGGSKRTCWQREAIVSITSPGFSVSRMRCTNEAGSSSVLSIRFADSSFIVSTFSMTNTRRRASNGVREAAATTGSVMSAVSSSWAPDGSTQVRSGWMRRATRARTPSGSAAPSASSSAAKALAISSFPLPAGPWNRYACEGRPPGGTAAPRTMLAWWWRSMPGSGMEGS